MILEVVFMRPNTDVPFFGDDPEFVEYAEAILALPITIEKTISEDGLTMTRIHTIPDEVVPDYIAVQEKYEAARQAELTRKVSEGIVFFSFER